MISEPDFGASVIKQCEPAFCSSGLALLPAAVERQGSRFPGGRVWREAPVTETKRNGDGTRRRSVTYSRVTPYRGSAVAGSPGVPVVTAPNDGVRT